jgi:uncharacterized protein YndB with AHSA1/START domain
MNPVPGGEFTVTDRRPNADGDESVFDAEHRGRYVVVDRPRLLVFDFSVPPYVEQSTRVTVEFRPLSAQTCELVLTHEMGEGELARAFADQTRKGWETLLTTLERELFPRRIGVKL